MKTWKNFLGAVLFGVASLASAGEPILMHLAGDGWPEFEKDLEKDGLLQGGSFSTEPLAILAAKIAVGKKLPVAAMPWPEFKAAFLKENNFGDMIKASDFRTLGRTKQILMPDAPAAAAATPVATTPVTSTGIIAPPVAAVAVVPAEPKGDAMEALVIASQFTSLEKQVATLKAEAAKSAATEEQVKATATRVGELQTQLTALTADQAKFAKKGEEGAALKATLDEQSKRINEALVGITASNDVALAALKTDVSQIRNQVTTLRADVAQVQASPLTQFGYYLAGAIGVLFLLVLALFGANRKRRLEAQEMKGSAASFEKKVTADLADVRVDMDILREKVSAVEKYIGIRWVNFPGDFDYQTNVLGPNNPEYTFMVNAKETPDEELTLRVVYEKAGYVRIFGIEGQTEPASIKKLRATIGKAAEVDVEGNSRLKGIDPMFMTTPSPKVVKMASAAMA